MKIPDRLSVETDSPYYNKVVLDKIPLVFFNGVQQSRVVEYCISEGWVRRSDNLRKMVSQTGKILAFKSFGKVEVRFS